MTITAITVVSGTDSLGYLQESLESYQDYVDEIIVANNTMTQEQLDFVKKTKARILPIHHVDYVELAREQMHKEAQSEYILVVDPDEMVTGGLIDELKKYAQEYDYVRIPRKNIIFGRWIEHSRWWPDYQLRFFKKGSVTWSTHLHSVPTTQGKGIDLAASEENAITHHNYDSVDHFVTKMIRYAKAEAAEKKKNDSYSLSVAIHAALDEFVSRYYYAQGYKDGIHGFVLSILQMFYPFFVYFYWWENNKYIDEKSNIKSAPYIYFKNGLLAVLHWSKKDLKSRLINKLLK